MIKNIIIGSLLALLLIPSAIASINGVILNKIDVIGNTNALAVYSTKATTPEGVYRIFISKVWGNGIAMQAIKIK